jgi:Tol biopolymer transport system component
MDRKEARMSSRVVTGSRWSIAVAVLLSALAVSLSHAPRASAAWPGRDGRVFFVYGREEGGEGTTFAPQGIASMVARQPATLRMLTDDPGDRDPQLSPDGRLVVFSRNLDAAGGERRAIFVMNTAGGGVRRLTEPPALASGQDREPSFARSGRRVLFAREESLAGHREQHIFSVGLDGSGLRQLTSGVNWDAGPAASPKGKILAFVRRPGTVEASGLVAYGKQHLYTMRVNGTAIKDETPRLDWNHFASEPDFSPNGRLIAFAAGGPAQIWDVRPNGTGLAYVSRLRCCSPAFLSPAFSPDGRWLLATRHRTEGAQIVRWAATPAQLSGHSAKHPETLAGAELPGESPAWQPRPPVRPGSG